MGPAPVLVRFYHCNARHHTLAVGYSPAGHPPFRLNHIMFEVNKEEDVGAAFDRVRTAGIRVDAGLGRHDNDRMFSFYIGTPAGFRIEVGFGARQISQPWSDNRRYERPSVWGHLPEGRPPGQ
jgi:catechol 2,3-dioxygenase-like lactoylglutathione lyase family enzyme